MGRIYQAVYNLQQLGTDDAVDIAIEAFQKENQTGNEFVNMDSVRVIFKGVEIEVTVKG